MRLFFDNKITFIPLGGSDQIGMNLNLYGYKGKWIIIDLGMTFADDRYPGIDVVLPDISFLKKNLDSILGIFLTHAHEDHLGAVPYLWEKIGCEIYATKFTKTVLLKKLINFGLDKDIIINEVEYNKNIDIGPFDIEYGNITHSIPESSYISISTDNNLVLHSGDWKFDNNPVIGEATNINNLSKLGEKNVSALVCDSTNVFNEGNTGSEIDIVSNISKVINDCDGKVIISTFASNIARIKTISNIAQTTNRKLVIIGRSLFRSIESAKECGYLTDIPQILNENQISSLNSNKIIIICTGCQGEHRAALNRISLGNTSFDLNVKDLVVLSSKIIPGNEKKISRMINRFVRLGISVITEKEYDIHVSGHPSRDDLKKMYELIKPNTVIPVHGEASHLKAHQDLALESGIPNALFINNGDVIAIGRDKCKVITNIKTGKLLLNGFDIIDEDSEVIMNRLRVMNNGVICIYVLLASDHKKPKDIFVSSIGVINNHQKLENEIEVCLININYNKVDKKNTLDLLFRQNVNRILRKITDKRPLVQINFKSIN